jgi:hypothetical protein
MVPALTAKTQWKNLLIQKKYKYLINTGIDLLITGPFYNRIHERKKKNSTFLKKQREDSFKVLRVFKGLKRKCLTRIKRGQKWHQSRDLP